MAFGAIIVLPILFGVFGIILGSLLELLVILEIKLKDLSTRNNVQELVSLSS
tara:strand:- start:806 stop:961 length:156 start_codon:yes stop_codon:yes gene_type:complete